MRRKHDTAETVTASMVERAKAGDGKVLEEIVRKIQDDIYGLAMRMLFVSADAEDATQEILIKVITGLGMFRGESRFETWVYRIASNHLLSTHRCRAERWKVTFETCEHMIDEGIGDTWEDHLAVSERKLIEEEVRFACVHFLLLCLKRPVRLAVILGEIMGVESRDAAEILGLAPAAYRQRLSRGRKQLLGFLVARCGFVDADNPCSCRKLAAFHVGRGHIDPKNLNFAVHSRHFRESGDSETLLKELDHLTRAIMVIRRSPHYEAPGVFVASMKRLIDSGRFQLLAG